MLTEDKKPLFDRLTALDPKKKKRQKKLFREEHGKDEAEKEKALKLTQEAYDEIFKFTEILLKDGYADITAFAMFQVLITLIGQMKQKDPYQTKKLIEKFVEMLKRV